MMLGSAADGDKPRRPHDVLLARAFHAQTANVSPGLVRIGYGQCVCAIIIAQA